MDPSVRSSPEVSFAIKVFTALDNNNYVKFFKLVRNTTYLNACILLRYFNDVRLQAVKRMIKASPRGSSFFPAYELLDTLAFEDLNSMGYFLRHYNVHINYADPNMPMVMFDRTSFSNNSDPYGPERAIKTVEEKRKCSIGETVYGKELVEDTFSEYDPHSSFDKNNYFKRDAVLAEDQGHTPIPVILAMVKKILNNKAIEKNPFETKTLPVTTSASNDKNFTFIFAEPKKINDLPTIPSLFESQTSNTIFNSNNIFKSAAPNDNSVLGSSQNPFKSSTSDFIFSKPVLTDNPNLPQSNNNFVSSSVFGNSTNSSVQNKPNIFASKTEQNIFSSISPIPKPFESLSKNIFSGQNKDGNIFGTSVEVKPNNNIFGSKMECPMYSIVDHTKKLTEDEKQNLFKNFSPLAPVITPNKFLEEEKQRPHTPFSSSARYVEEEKKRLAEEKRLEDIKKELQKQEERRRQIEEDLANLARRKELERIEAEKKKKFEEFVESYSKEVSSELIKESTEETCKYLLQEESDRLNDITALAELTVKNMCCEIIDEECEAHIKMEVNLLQIRSRLRARRALIMWKELVARSQKRRSLLVNTPIWIHSQSPPTASPNQSDILKRMRDFHYGKNCTFKLPTKSTIVKLDVFEIVKKYLMKRCQTLDQNPFSVDVYWKVVIDLPLEGETSEYSNFYHTWTTYVFSNCSYRTDDTLLYFSENYWYKKFLVSLCRHSDDVHLKSISEANGLLFYGTVNRTNFTAFKERIDISIKSKNKLNSVPVALILTPETTDLTDTIEKHLMQFECRKLISAYKIYIAADVTDASLSAHSIKALKWLALNSPPKPPLEMNELKTFLDQCIGSELWYRFKLSLNSSIRGAFESVEIVIKLYNEAVDRTLEIACNEELKLYPTFPKEFERYVTSSTLYPKDYEHFPTEWSSNMKVLKDVISSLKMPQYSEKWPPSSWQSFQVSIKSYINLLNWYKDSKRVFLKVLALFLNVDGNDPDCSGFSWLDVMQVLVDEKIKYIFDKVVVYNKFELEHFRTTPWWYRSECTKNVCPFVEEMEIHFLENTLEDLGINSSSKKRKLDTSADSIPDEDWLSTTLDHIDRSISNNSLRKRMLEDLEHSIQVETKRHAEIDALLKMAL